MAKLYEHFQYPNKGFNEFPKFLAGIECEIESVDHLNKHIPEFNSEPDGSLRNNGTEFISVPLERDKLLTSFKNLHAELVYHNKAEAFSPRTSTHVHINVRNLEPEQLRQLLLFYALFEDYFFAMVSPVRRNNIHCVPLHETTLPTRYGAPLKSLLNIWHKYTAFNLLPVSKQGTVEFRHLQGTDDAELLDRWLKTIENLWSLAQRETITADNILKTRHIESWFDTIFADAPEVLALRPTMENTIANSLVDVKFALI